MVLKHPGHLFMKADDTYEQTKILKIRTTNVPMGATGIYGEHGVDGQDIIE
jgi:hypothetical protein